MSLFWVQIHNLPFSLLSLDVAISIGENLGEVQQMDNQSKMIGGNFLKVRVVKVSPNLYVKEGKFLLRMILRDGFHLNITS